MPPSRPNANAYILGIAGGSCSGKTTLAKSLALFLGEAFAAVLYQDSYYIDQSAKFREDGGEVNFDHPDAIDFDLLARQLNALKRGKTIAVPIYDFKTHSRQKNTDSFPPKSVVLLDGTLILSQAQIRAQLDGSVFISTPEELRLSRRKERDVRERGRTVEGVLKQFQNHVKPMHDQFVEPSKAHAKELFSGDRPLAESARVLADELILKLKLC